MKTLSNHHSPEVLQAASGLMRRGKDDGGSREIKQKAVPCLAQTKEYCEMFHLIDKGNGKEAKYDMAGKSRSHNWAPHDSAGRFDHRRFVLWGPIYYEFNEGVTSNSYVGRIHKRTHFWFPPFVRTYPKSTSPSFFIPARTQIGFKLLT